MSRFSKKIESGHDAGASPPSRTVTATMVMNTWIMHLHDKHLANAVVPTQVFLGDDE